MLVPDDLKYAETHEWVRTEGEAATIGITDHAQAELTDIVFVELPKIGTPLAARQAAAIIESVKAASDVYSPVSGEVVEINPDLESRPELVNTDPYGAGWLFKLRLKDPDELNGLKTARSYRRQIGA
ncbi:MAG: glycine cleavage system protein GcvH [Verrucomicrobia bacterium]|nr:glycine cleavage system protein GcvH [Verrucomicrobiota bacterium]